MDSETYDMYALNVITQRSMDGSGEGYQDRLIIVLTMTETLSQDQRKDMVTTGKPNQYYGENT